MKEIMYDKISADKDTMFQNTTLEVRDQLDRTKHCTAAYSACMTPLRAITWQ
jgi:hypothetical protein